jgi:nicotinamide-nucleotide amidase
MLDRADAVVVCGGLGPTQDDVTREAIAAVMGVELERRDELVAHIEKLFGSRLRDMPLNNLRQADVPVGADAIPNPIGTAPGIRAEFDGKVVYAVPGVPYEMQLMIAEQVLPDLLTRSGESAVIVSRSLKTWGQSESGLAEMIAHRVDAQTNPTIAFLARGIEGLVVRLTAKAATDEEARALIEAEEAELRAILGALVFGVDEETIEHAALRALEARGWTLGVAESLTAGLIGARIGAVPGASRTFRGSIASYATEVKQSVLGVTTDHVVSEQCAIEMATGAQRVLGADVGIAATGVAGPDEQDGQPPGTVWFAIALPGRPPEAFTTRLPGDRERVRQFSAISLLNALRQRLESLA